MFTYHGARGRTPALSKHSSAGSLGVDNEQRIRVCLALMRCARQIRNNLTVSDLMTMVTPKEEVFSFNLHHLSWIQRTHCFSLFSAD